GNDDGIRPIQLVVKALVDGLARGRSETLTRVEPAADIAAAAAPAAAAPASKFPAAK
ncbi:MAG TPA: 30S ribosomal protein S2, partial [Planctomycetes bacterium]|nr:30S ribosomal protein S2 [Planctomycetota bacterium]